MKELKNRVRLGDFVKSNNFVGEIVGLNDDAVSVKTKNSSGADMIITSGWNLVEPIVFIDDILMKNGFFYNEYNGNWFYEYCDTVREVMKQIDISLDRTVDPYTQEKIHLVTVSPQFIDEIDGQRKFKTLDELQQFLDSYDISLKINPVKYG